MIYSPRATRLRLVTPHLRDYWEITSTIADRAGLETGQASDPLHILSAHDVAERRPEYDGDGETVYRWLWRRGQRWQQAIDEIAGMPALEPPIRATLLAALDQPLLTSELAERLGRPAYSVRPVLLELENEQIVLGEPVSLPSGRITRRWSRGPRFDEALSDDISPGTRLLERLAAQQRWRMGRRSRWQEIGDANPEDY